MRQIMQHQTCSLIKNVNNSCNFCLEARTVYPIATRAGEHLIRASGSNKPPDETCARPKQLDNDVTATVLRAMYSIHDLLVDGKNVKM